MTAPKPRGKAAAKPSTPAARPTEEADAVTKAAPRLPRPGAGRPRKPTAPRNEDQIQLAEALKTAGAWRDKCAAAYLTDNTVAVELEMLRAEMLLASSWAVYLQAQGNHTHALKYGDAAAKLSGRITALRERVSDDLLATIAARKGRERALGSKR